MKLSTKLLLMSSIPLVAVLMVTYIGGYYIYASQVADYTPTLMEQLTRGFINTRVVWLLTLTTFIVIAGLSYTSITVMCMAQELNDLSAKRKYYMDEGKKLAEASEKYDKNLLAGNIKQTCEFTDWLVATHLTYAKGLWVTDEVAGEATKTRSPLSSADTITTAQAYMKFLADSRRAKKGTNNKQKECYVTMVL